MRHPRCRCHKYPILFTLAMAFLLERSLAFAPSMARSALGCEHRMLGLPKISTIVPNRAASWRTDSLRHAMSGEGDIKDEDEEELEGLEEFYAQKAERERQQSMFNGGMFPGDFTQATKANDEITIQEAKIETGTPQILVGFWKVGSKVVSTYVALSGRPPSSSCSLLLAIKMEKTKYEAAYWTNKYGNIGSYLRIR